MRRTAKWLNDYLRWTKKLLKMIEAGCITPQFLMSFPDGFMSRKNKLACNVDEFFNPQEYGQKAKNLNFAFLGRKGRNLKRGVLAFCIPKTI